MARLARPFFARDTVAVAHDLLGKRLVRVLAGQRLSGLISETEAYRGADDQASHAYRLTPRSAIMYGPPGHAYVYLIYGRNYCLNMVTETAGLPGAVLIRGILPDEGIETMRLRRGVRFPASASPAVDARLTDGPGKVCQALGIDLALNGADLVTDSALYVEDVARIQGSDVRSGPRVGVRGDAETRLRPWRFQWRTS